MKLTLIKEPDPSNIHDISKVTMEIDADGLPEVLREIELFLQAAGFCIDGHLDVIKEGS